MTDKPIKASTLSKTEKAVKMTSKTAKPVKTAAASKVDKPVEVASAKIIEKTPKVVTTEPLVKGVKKTVAVKSEKKVMVDKEALPKKKRISKGLATHNRRVKQEKRSPKPVHK